MMGDVGLSLSRFNVSSSVKTVVSIERPREQPTGDRSCIAGSLMYWGMYYSCDVRDVFCG